MSSKLLIDDLEDEDPLAPAPFRKERQSGLTRKMTDFDRRFVRKQSDKFLDFQTTYKASRHEAGWLLKSIGTFYEHHWITDVLRLVQEGKEASVYLCATGEALNIPLVAAKVYRPRQFRSLKNDSLYREGRVDLDEDGEVVGDDNRSNAIRKRTSFGEELRHQSWIAYEYKTLQILHDAGADVPRCLMMSSSTPTRSSPCSTASFATSTSCWRKASSMATCPPTTSSTGKAISS